jgi:PRC-barrel domain
MAESSDVGLIRLSRSDLAFEDPLGDVRGRNVVTVDEESFERFGTVADLLLDGQERTIRFLEIDAEGPLGVGRHQILIPVRVVDWVDEYHVYVDCARELIITAPAYNPHAARMDVYLEEVYEHFG